MTVHLIYVSGDPVDSTQAIVHETVPRLRARHDIVVHHPSDPITIEPRPGDVLIGHPNRYGDCIFRRSFVQPGWARRIVFAPFSYGMPADAALIDDLVMEADLYLAISGDTWWQGLPDSVLSHWRYKMVPFDLGVNRTFYPPLRSHCNPPGQRKFLYIGGADPMKGGDYLAELANRNPDLHFGWLRTGDGRHCLDHSEELQTPAIRKRLFAANLTCFEGVYWRHPEGLKILAEHDFVINCGRSDAMPCEILECAGWGLVPVVTPQSGYAANDWLTHIPLDRPDEASAILQAMNHWPDELLRRKQAAGWAQLDARYNWDRAAEQLHHAIACPIPSMPTDKDWQGRASRNRLALRQTLARVRRAERLHAVGNGLRRAARAIYAG